MLPPDTRIGIVAARFNEHVVGKLVEGCLRRLGELGVDAGHIALHRVPGAFELPLAAKALAQTHRHDAVICLGCVIRGDTPHFDFVAGECARGIQQVGIETGVPVIFGVLTTNTEEQAQARAGGAHGHAGVSSADAAAEMVALLQSLKI
jgi:6,7-dimethyl-8-ribityllumazine synthase